MATWVICTVIDEGVLNTDSAGELRRWLLQKCRVKAVVRLPEETFKPNKINVRSSILYFERRSNDDVDLEENYSITFCDIESLGYNGAGDKLRGFDFTKLKDEISREMLNVKKRERSGYKWTAFNVQAEHVVADGSCRLDYKYWHPAILHRISELREAGAPTITGLNMIETRRGKSPEAELYVDEADGYALVVKAGTNITKFGELATDGDYVEKNVYDELETAHIQSGDILLASTGDGTLGKCCVYRLDKPAVADGHVTVIRVDQTKVWPEYIADYLRVGFGSQQIARLFTGSTGLIELTPEHVKSIVIDLPTDLSEQRRISSALRAKETEYRTVLQEAEDALRKAIASFDQPVS